jgi:hypothetical protein
MIKITGRSLEAILDRRVVWNKTVLYEGFQNGVKRLLTENAINPEIPARQIPNLVFRDSTDPVITSLGVDTQFYGENLYDAIKMLCEDNDVGFKITLENGQMIFQLYYGVYRTEDQTAVPLVEFSGRLDNLTGSNYAFSMVNLKNTAKVVDKLEKVTEDEPDPVVTDVTIDNLATGLARRELFFNSTGLSRTYEDGTEMSPEDYLSQLQMQGFQELYDTVDIEAFDGELDASHEYVYGRDFFLGDVVQFENSYGMRAMVRVTEVIHTHDSTGEKIIPSFVTVI